MKRASILLGLGLAMSATSSHAAWDTYAFGEDGCVSENRYGGPGETILAIGATTGGGFFSAIRNDNWSLRDERSYDISIVMGDAQYGPTLSRSHSLEGGLFVVTVVGKDYIEDIANNQTATFFNGEILMDKLSLKGSAAAIQRLKTCVNQVKAANAEKERKLNDPNRIPLDPFSGKH